MKFYSDFASGLLAMFYFTWPIAIFVLFIWACKKRLENDGIISSKKISDKKNNAIDSVSKTTTTATSNTAAKPGNTDMQSKYNLFWKQRCKSLANDDSTHIPQIKEELNTFINHEKASLYADAVTFFADPHHRVYQFYNRIGEYYDSIATFMLSKISDIIDSLDDGNVKDALTGNLRYLEHDISNYKNRFDNPNIFRNAYSLLIRCLLAKTKPAIPLGVDYDDIAGSLPYIEISTLVKSAVPRNFEGISYLYRDYDETAYGQDTRIVYDEEFGVFILIKASYSSHDGWYDDWHITKKDYAVKYAGDPAVQCYEAEWVPEGYESWRHITGYSGVYFFEIKNPFWNAS